MQFLNTAKNVKQIWETKDNQQVSYKYFTFKNKYIKRKHVH